MNKHLNNFFKMLDVWAVENPKPMSDLKYVNPYTFVVAVILSAQSTDKSVNLATEKLFPVADNPKAMLDLCIDNLKSYIKTIGLYNNKAKSIIDMSQDLINRFNGKVPDNRDDLESLAGVGRKSANVIMNHIYGADTIAVDTHVIRLVNRFSLFDLDDENTAGINTESPVEIEKLLLRITPDKYKGRVSDWLVLHGRYVCKAKKPECDKCSVAKYCLYKDFIK